jgi:hypothetical protein
MSLGHNIALSGLGPFSALNFQGGGQAIPGLPFPMQAGNAAMLQNQLNLGLSGMLPGQRPAPVGVAQQQGPGDFLSRGVGQLPEQEILVNNSKETDKSGNPGSSRGEERRKMERRELGGRKRARSSSNGDSDDDIMVLSNSPSSNETNDRRDAGSSQSKAWENPSVISLVAPNGALGFSMSNNGLVNGTLGYPPDPSSLMAAMGSQMPYEVKTPIGVLLATHSLSYIFFSLV